jgi:hypothetical protein
MAGKWDEWEVYVPPPRTNGSSLTPRTPYGGRRVAVTSAAAEVVLTGDVYLCPPDSGGNPATSDMTDVVMLRVTADKDDICVLFGAKGAALTPDPAAVGASANVCDIVIQGTFLDFVVSPKTDQSMYVRSRANNAGATVAYRLAAPVSGLR